MDTSHMTRHVGKMANTDQRLIVAFMQIREQPDHALVIPMDNLPERLEQAVTNVLRTPEGQQPGPLALVLDRHLMPDTGVSLFRTLHTQGKLMKVPVRNVLMLPMPNMPVPLSTILEQQGLLQQPVNPNYANDKFNPHTHNQRADTNENARAVARTLLLEAEDLESIARHKRAQAYAKDPSMQQSNPPPKPVQSVAASYPTTPTTLPTSNPWTSVPSAPEAYVPFARTNSGLPGEGVGHVAETVPEVSPAMPLVAPQVALEERIGKIEAMLVKLIEADQKPEKKKPAKDKAVEEPVQSEVTHVHA